MSLHMETVFHAHRTALAARAISSVHNVGQVTTMIIKNVFNVQLYSALTVMALALPMFVQCAKMDFT